MDNKKVKYYLNPSGEFVIENYNLAKPLANFFPGIAGRYGVPMWAFYVNRSQCISSFGVKDKDHAILEFFPANKSWQFVSSQGFRTFIKITDRKKIIPYEPFHNGYINSAFNLNNRMSITSYGLELEENNSTLGLKTAVEYFTIPQDNYAALARIVRIRNTSRQNKKIQLLDGLPQIIPYGTSNLFLKKLSRTIEAWMSADILKEGAAFYKLSVDPTDRPEVVHITEGNFYLAFHYDKKTAKIIRPLVNPQSIFGQITDFYYPGSFMEAANFRCPKEIVKSKTPCAFLFLDFILKPGEEKSFYSVIGYMRSCQILASSIKKITMAGYLSAKKEENKKIIQELQSDIKTQSSLREFDLYAQQSYLDNILRGGYPVVFKSKPSDSVFYLYSRKHGDLERDYNKFLIQPSYFSQGNGNYRDINQNRRCDNWFNPEVTDENVITFFNLLQADGFNPLVIKGSSFTLKDKDGFKTTLKKISAEIDIPKIIAFLDKPFSPGEIILFAEENKIKLKTSYDKFLSILLSNSEEIQEAEHGEGFWIDHWHYNLDLLENYLSIYPEKLKEITLEKKDFTFYDNAEIVKPRCEKYVLYEGSVKQLHCVVVDNAKKEMIHKRKNQPHLVRTEYGTGVIYKTTLVNKLLCLLTNKLASFDPFGCGLEMEANKPNWFDALNGLPALFGSSLSETFELKRLVLLIKEILEKTGVEKIYLSEELHEFLVNLGNLLKEYLNTNSGERDYQYWDKSYSLKEGYRHKTRFGFSGKETELKAQQLGIILNDALGKIDSGINKTKYPQKELYPAYFINEVKEYASLKAGFVKPLKFIQKKLPLFLEAQMHALRMAENKDQAKDLYQATKKSLLYDKKLKMYKVTAPLEGMPKEIGRCSVFTPGWLENESIWLHMEYKYLLELLKNGLCEEFYADFKEALIPFQKPSRYGRSILENSSFLVSSAFPDKSLHGNGFVARLSGSTVEFLNMWLVMNLGKNPFILNDKNELNLKFSPLLAGWLFDKKGTYTFNFLSKISVTYYNPKRKDTFGRNSVKPVRIVFADKNTSPVSLSSDTIPHPYARQVRARQIKRIEIYLE